MGAAAQDLSALISTRICHDLINPIGAINNGLELLEFVQPQKTPEMELVAQSAAQANAKLSFFRLASSNASAESQMQGGHVGKIVADMFEAGRFNPQWQVDDIPLPRREVKMACLLLMCIESALKTGGDCAITHDNGTWKLTATGRRVEPEASHWSMILSGTYPEALTAKEVQFAMARQTAELMERQVGLSTSEGSMIVGF